MRNYFLLIIQFFFQEKTLKRLTLFFSLLLLIITSFLTACQDQFSSNHSLELSFWHAINPPQNREVFNQLVAKFNQRHPEIQIKPLYIGQSDTQLPKILTAVVGNVPPEMLWISPEITGQLVDLEAVIPLEDWFFQSPLKEEFDSKLLENMQLNNHIWSIPFARNNTAIFYRPSLFAKAGITELPETWEEFKTVAKKLTQDRDQDGKIDQYGMLLSLGKGEWVVFVWLPFIFSADGEIVENNYPQLVNEGTIKTLQFGQDLVKEGVAILSSPERGYELDQFLAGKVAMQVTGPWTLGQLKATGVDYDVFPIPYLKERSAVVGGENVFVFKTTPEKEKASQVFLEYILGQEFQKEWALKTGYLPVNTKVKNSPEYQEFVEKTPVLKTFLKQMEWTRSRPIVAGYSNISEELGRAIESVLLEKKTPEVALQESQKRLELTLDR